MASLRDLAPFFLAVLATACSREANAETVSAPPGARVPVVVELFTSEGCSSCPPADEALAALPLTPRADAADVIPLAFHVDYWNYLGWSDPFSSAKNSERQRVYSNALGSHVYTPQAVVDGTNDVLGSDRGALSRAIAQSSKTAKADVSVTVKADGDTLTIDATSNAIAPSSEVLFAITQGHARIAVQRGENSGRELLHTAIVRSFVVVRRDADQHARATLTLPPQLPRNDVRIVAVVSDASTRRVLGAASRPL